MIPKTVCLTTLVFFSVVSGERALAISAPEQLRITTEAEQEAVPSPEETEEEPGTFLAPNAVPESAPEAERLEVEQGEMDSEYPDGRSEPPDGVEEPAEQEDAFAEEAAEPASPQTTPQDEQLQEREADAETEDFPSRARSRNQRETKDQRTLSPQGSTDYREEERGWRGSGQVQPLTSSGWKSKGKTPRQPDIPSRQIQPAAPDQESEATHTGPEQPSSPEIAE